MARIVVAIGFLIAFAAGLVVGLEMRQTAVASPPTTRPHGPDGFLARELNLSAKQQEQLHQIWSETVHRGGREQDDRRRQLREERDNAIAALVHPEDKGKYDEIVAKYTEQRTAMDNQMRASFQAAVEKTKEILTPEQRAKYEKILAQRQLDRGPDRGGRERDNSKDPNRRGDDHATSRSASQP